jgi:methyl-accepting chemotaxis protein
MIRLPVAEVTALAPSDGLEKPIENLGDLVDQVFEKSTGEINNLIDEFERLRGKLKTDGENIKREVEEYGALSQQVMELTKTVSASVEKVRASVDR